MTKTEKRDGNDVVSRGNVTVFNISVQGSMLMLMLLLMMMMLMLMLMMMMAMISGLNSKDRLRETRQHSNVYLHLPLEERILLYIHIYYSLLRIKCKDIKGRKKGGAGA